MHDKAFSLFQSVEFAHIEQLEVFHFDASDKMVGADLQVEIHNGEALRPVVQKGE